MIGQMDIDKVNKGNVTTVHNAISATATSAAIDCRGKNGLLMQVEFSAAANWTFKIQGSLTQHGTYADWYEQANTGVMKAMSYQTNASKGFTFKGVPDWVKIVATEDVDGATVTVKAQPINL
jgi:hypothetical protein